MRITNWTAKVVATIAAERGKSKALKRLIVGAVLSGSLALAASSAIAQTNHAIQDPSFDEIDLVADGNPFGTGHFAYIKDITDCPWVAVRGNNNSWLFNTAYAEGSFTVPTPLSADNAAHLADGNILQIIGDPFVSGRRYLLSAWVHYDVDPYIGDDFGLRLFDGTSGMFDGSEIFAAQDYLFGVDIFDDNMWREMTLTFTAGNNANGKSIGIYLGSEAAANRITVDDVTLTSVLLGDYNNDNIVDAADYVAWRKNDINGQQGYTDWRNNFGNSAGSSASAAQSLSAGAVPEPSICFLACAATAGFLTLVRRSTGSWRVTD
jgi:hypothetical protein